MATENITLVNNTPSTVVVASGAANVTITPRSYGCEWALTNGAAAPTINYWHVAKVSEDLSMALISGERLWVRGKGVLVVTTGNAA